MKKIIFVLALSLMLVNICFAKHLHPERWYQDRWVVENGGTTEYRLDDGKRVDILTDQYAIEVDFAPKFYQAVGQCLLYAARTGKQPGYLPCCKGMLE